ncbi:hypothetical protein [Pseudomonas sp.]|uniref:hypothetical protein n=1 Tax=Pseudomonas sp. TaxID=306 RepID=UPI003FD7C9F8
MQDNDHTQIDAIDQENLEFEAFPELAAEFHADEKNWTQELINRAADVAAEHGCTLLRSADGCGTGADNYGGLQIINRESREPIVGLHFELSPTDVLAHFGVAP